MSGRVDVTRRLQRELTPDQPGDRLLEMMLRTANGRLTATEAPGRREFVLNRFDQNARVRSRPRPRGCGR